jgi:hypothetical protein
LRLLDPAEWPIAILFLIGVGAVVVAMLVVTSPSSGLDAVLDLGAKWTIGVALVVLGLVCFGIAALNMLALLPSNDQRAWLPGLSPVLGVTFFLFWVGHTVNPPAEDLMFPWDPRLQPAYMLAQILFAGFFGGLVVISGPMTLLRQIIRRRDRSDTSSAAEGKVAG